MYHTVTNSRDLIKNSKNKPQLLFKHSVMCPLSINAKEIIDEFVTEDKPFESHMLIVQEQPEVSKELEEKLKIKHETPQLILLKEGVVKGKLDKSEITKDNINKLLEKI